MRRFCIPKRAFPYGVDFYQHGEWKFTDFAKNRADADSIAELGTQGGGDSGIYARVRRRRDNYTVAHYKGGKRHD